MNKRKLGSFVLCAMLFALCVSADAQQAGKVARIGFLDPSTVTGSAAQLETFRQELSKLGWIEGKNIVFEYRFAELKPERVAEVAAELVRLKVDLIVTTGNPPALAAQKATSTIPIVMMGVVDPVALGLVASLARPGGNITGFGGLASELITKRLEVLKDAVPKLDRVGLLVRQTGNPGEELQLKELGVAASALEVKLEEIKTQRDAQGLESAFKTAKQKQVKAIMTPALRFFFAERKRIVELAVNYRLPAIYPNKGYVDEGGLMSYGEDYVGVSTAIAGYVDKVLKGARPADLPVERPTTYEFIINLSTARALGLAIPPSLLLRADRVIE